jgi:outer membrane protein TolC
MIRAFCTVVAALTFAATPLLAEVVTIDEYLDRVKTTHPYFQVERMQPEIDKKQSDRFLGWQDWRLLADGSFTHLEPLQTSPFDPERVDVVILGAGTQRLFWGSGSRLSLGWTTDITDQNLPGFTVPGPPGQQFQIPIGPSTYYRNVLSASWSLPLWQNRGGELDRLEYDLSLFDVDVSGIAALERQEEFVLEVATKFLAWTLAEEQIRIGEDRLELALEELERMERKRAAFLVDEVDVLRARDAVFNTRSALELIESQWKAVQADLATLANDDGIYGKKPEYDIYLLTEPSDVESVVDFVTRESRLVRELDIRREQLVRLESSNDDLAKPELALNLRAALLGGDENIGGSFEMTNPDVGVGLEFRYPLGNRTASADFEKTRLQIRQLEKSKQNAQVTLEAAARSILTRMQELRDVIASNVAAIESNRKRTEEEQKLYDQGRGDLTFVIQSRDRVAISQLEYAENAATYHGLILQLEALTDELLPTPPTNAE